MPYVRCRACGHRNYVRRELLGSTISCPRCSASTVAQVTLLHPAHSSGLIVGLAAIALAIASAACATWSALHPLPGEAVPPGVRTVAYVAVISFIVGIALVGRYTAATMPRQL